MIPGKKTFSLLHFMKAHANFLLTLGRCGHRPLRIMPLPHLIAIKGCNKIVHSAFCRLSTVLLRCSKRKRALDIVPANTQSEVVTKLFTVHFADWVLYLCTAPIEKRALDIVPANTQSEIVIKLFTVHFADWVLYFCTVPNENVLWTLCQPILSLRL